MKKLPAAVVIIDMTHEMNAVKEANKLGIPIVAIVDTNGDPTMVQYPVAANDDAVKSIQVITNLFADAILVAKDIYQKRVIEERDAKAAAAKKAAEEKAEKAEKAPAKKAPAKKAPAKKAPAKKAAAPKEEVKAEETPKAE
jgi:small subunit ribosomal protein S2